MIVTVTHTRRYRWTGWWCGTLLLLACATVLPTPAPHIEARGPPVLPPRVERAAVERIRARVRSIDASIASGVARASYLVAPANASWWKLAASLAECQDWPGLDDPRFPQDCAVVWRVGDQVVRVRRIDQSQSGDWWAQVEFTFWPDGHTAFRLEEWFPQICAVSDESRTPEECGSEARDYWDQAGLHVRELKNRWELRDGKRVPAGEGLEFPFSRYGVEDRYLRSQDMPLLLPAPARK